MSHLRSWRWQDGISYSKRIKQKGVRKMVADRILGNYREWDATKEMVKVALEWFELEKKRICKVAEDGTELGICIPELLKDGDVIAQKENKVYVVEVIPSHLIKVHVHTMQEIGRLCFELGNRHLSLQIMEHEVRVPFDQPTFDYLIKLGFEAEEVTEQFTDFIECKAHGHSHGVHSHGHDHSHVHTH